MDEESPYASASRTVYIYLVSNMERIGGGVVSLASIKLVQSGFINVG
jgi:hypothetical protein